MSNNPRRTIIAAAEAMYNETNRILKDGGNLLPTPLWEDVDKYTRATWLHTADLTVTAVEPFIRAQGVREAALYLFPARGAYSIITRLLNNYADSLEPEDYR